MFSSSTTNTLMSPFPPYYFPSSSPFHQPQPQPQPPPPPPPPIPPLIPNQNDNIFLHQNHQYDHLFSLANAQIPESTLINLGVISNTTTTTMANIMTSTATGSTKQDLIINGGGSRLLAPKFLPKKPGAVATKKDRHSKIYTAQGLRDRRVRLSIDIAREFFDLHDMLGFDKASKTLEWLLTKSKKAIKELSRSKLRTSTTTKINSTTWSSTGAADSDQCEQAMSEVNELVAAADHDINVPKRNVPKEKLIDAETLSEAALMNLLAKESRATARARARARTKEKRHNNSCNTTTSTTAYNNNNNNNSNNNNSIRSSNYSNNMEKYISSSGGSSSHQTSNHHQLLIRTVLLNQLDHQRDIDHQTQGLTPNLVEEKGLLVRMDTNHDHHQDDDDDNQEEEPVVMIKRKLYDHRDDHEGQFCGIPSKGGASNNVIYSSSPSLLLTQNWDNNNNISTASPHPAAASFCLPT